MNVFVFLYDQFAEFEIVQALLILGEAANIKFVGFESSTVTSWNKFRVEVDFPIEEVEPSMIDLFIIPGGNPKNFIRNPTLERKIERFNHLLTTLNDQKKLIAAICGGPVFLAHAGILQNRKCTASIGEDEQEFFQGTDFTEADTIVDENLLTAQGQAFTEFALEIGRMTQVLENEQEIEETRNWLHNSK